MEVATTKKTLKYHQNEKGSKIRQMKRREVNDASFPKKNDKVFFMCNIS
jgi:hypothetical protein